MNGSINGRMVSYQNDLRCSYMVIKLLQIDVIAEYQIRMIQENPAKQLLAIHKKQIDNDIYFYFDITSKTTLNQLLKRMKVNKHKLLSIIKSLIRSIELGKQYLLQDGSFILQGDYIYIDPASLEISIAYLPIASEVDINQEVKDLIMDLLIYKASFETPAEGDFVYELLNLIKGENFSLNQLDQMISNIALGQEQKNSLNLSEPQELMQNDKSFVEDRIMPKAKLNDLIFILSQLFFVAIMVLLVRVFYFQKDQLEVYTLLGIITIITALDILIIRELRVKNKSASNMKQSSLKNEKAIQALKPNKHKEKNKSNRFSKSNNMVSKEYVSVQGYMDPKDFETRVMIEEIPNIACLVGFGENAQEKIIIDKPSFVIGRIKSQSDYISSNGAVGKLHAEITYKDGSYYMKDLNSRNGTFINGERIVSNVEYSMQNNDRIAFANSEYKFLWS